MKKIEFIESYRIPDDGGDYQWDDNHGRLIRCKDCKHYYYADNRIPQEQRYTCALDGDRWKPEDFCSYAERKTE